MRKSKLASVALIIYVVSFFTFFTLEGQRSGLNNPDADNPRESMGFLASHTDIFTYTGLASLSMSVSLAIAFIGLEESIYVGKKTTIVKLGLLFGLFAALFFFGQGILRIQAPGPLLHMSGLNPDWGNSGYVAVQIIGTQGVGSAAGFALSFAAILLSIDNFQKRRFSRLMSVVGIFGIFTFLVAFFGPILQDSEIIYPIYIFSLLLTQIWYLGLGIWAYRN